MKTAFTTFLVAMCLVLIACGGGSTSEGGGEPSSKATIPQDISNSYSGSWDGSATGVAGIFDCEGTYNLGITQSGSTVAVAFSVTSSSGIGPCSEAFDFSGSGTYIATDGGLAIMANVENYTVLLNGTASEQDGKTTISGAWSIANTNPAVIISSGNWTVEAQ